MVLSIFLVFFIRGYVYEPWQIPSGSMKPNLEVGDFVLVNRNAYGLEVPFTGREKVFSKGPEVGEIVVFFPPHKPTVPFVKRVIAKGGDKITYINKKFYINGEIYKQDFIEKDAFGAELFTENNSEDKYLIRHMQRAAIKGDWLFLKVCILWLETIEIIPMIVDLGGLLQKGQYGEEQTLYGYHGNQVNGQTFLEQGK